MPVILTSAILINLQVWSKMLADRGFTLFGTFSADGAPASGLIFMLTPPNTFAISILSAGILLSVLIGIILAYSVFREKRSSLSPQQPQPAR